MCVIHRCVLIVAFVFRIVVFFGANAVSTAADGGGGGGGGRVHDDYHSTECVLIAPNANYIETERSVCLLKLAYARNAIIYQKRFHFITRE